MESLLEWQGIKSITYQIIKRGMDIVGSLLALVILAPLFVIIAVVVRLEDGGKAFYKHKRIGKDGKTIYLYKFRSMVVNAAEVFENFTKEQKEEYEKFFKLENDPRITRVGNILRKTSLDELPQLVNILKGDMSFIGPRPVVEKELEKFGENRDKLLSIKPGLTGWWACCGRSNTTYEERVALEMYYVEHCCLKLDIICFFKTIGAVLKRDGAK